MTSKALRWGKRGSSGLMMGSMSIRSKKNSRGEKEGTRTCKPLEKDGDDLSSDETHPDRKYLYIQGEWAGGRDVLRIIFSEARKSLERGILLNGKRNGTKATRI